MKEAIRKALDSHNAVFAENLFDHMIPSAIDSCHHDDDVYIRMKLCEIIASASKAQMELQRVGLWNLNQIALEVVHLAQREIMRPGSTKDIWEIMQNKADRFEEVAEKEFNL